MRRVNAQRQLIGSVKNEDFIFSLSLFHNFLLNIFDYLQLYRLSVGFEIMFYRYAFKTENLSLIDTRTGSAAAEKQRQTRDSSLLLFLSCILPARAGMICPNIITGQTLSLDRDIFVQS